MRIVLIVGAALALAGCSKGHLEFPKPPADKLVCPDEPAAPARTGPNGGVTDEAAGNYMRSLRGSWQGCKADVDFLRDWFGALDRAAAKQKVR